MTEKGDSQSLSALQMAVNDSAGKAALLWTSFMTLGAYLLIATGSVRHRELFLNSSIKLPVLGVELPVTGYFLVAPMIFLIFHFYLLLQLDALSEKAADYNVVLHDNIKVAADRRRMRWQLDDFPLLQYLAGVRERRTGLVGELQILISWITIVLFPLAVLLQLQIVFLPYHSVSITWLHRICLIADLGLISLFWHQFRRRSQINRPRRRIPLLAIEIGGAILILVFSLSLATFPGELMYRNPIAKLIDRAVSFVFRDEAITASRYFFEGDVDGVTGQSGSLFANRIVLPDERFFDPSKKTDTSVSLRGRNLRGAVLPRADLSFADFTGATLEEASFLGATLQRARFGCAAKLQLSLGDQIRERAKAESCDDEHTTNLRGADFSQALMHGAQLNHAKLRGARFVSAMMQGASADKADLTGATFTYARMEGASLVNATLLAASFVATQMQGTDLSEANLSDALLLDAQLQGAKLKGAKLNRAVLRDAGLYRAFVDLDKHQQAIFKGVHARSTFPRSFLLGQRGRERLLLPEMLDSTGFQILQTRALQGILSDEVRQVVVARLQPLDPSKPPEEGQLVLDRLINSDRDAYQMKFKEWANAIIGLICVPDGAPYIARAFIYNGRIAALQTRDLDMSEDAALRAIATLRDVSCQGALGLDIKDVRELAKIERQVLAIKARKKRNEVVSGDSAK